MEQGVNRLKLLVNNIRVINAEFSFLSSFFSFLFWRRGRVRWLETSGHYGTLPSNTVGVVMWWVPQVSTVLRRGVSLLGKPGVSAILQAEIPFFRLQKHNKQWLFSSFFSADRVWHVELLTYSVLGIAIMVDSAQTEKLRGHPCKQLLGSKIRLPAWGV